MSVIRPVFKGGKSKFLLFILYKKKKSVNKNSGFGELLHPLGVWDEKDKCGYETQHAKSQPKTHSESQLCTKKQLIKNNKSFQCSQRFPTSL